MRMSERKTRMLAGATVLRAPIPFCRRHSKFLLLLLQYCCCLSIHHTLSVNSQHTLCSISTSSLQKEVRWIKKRKERTMDRRRRRRHHHKLKPTTVSLAMLVGFILSFHHLNANQKIASQERKKKTVITRIKSSSSGSSDSSSSSSSDELDNLYWLLSSSDYDYDDDEFDDDDDDVIHQPTNLLLDTTTATSKHQTQKQTSSSSSFQCPKQPLSIARAQRLQKQILGHKQRKNKQKTRSFTRRYSTQVSPDDALLLHLGKAGGGTISQRFIAWGFSLEECHGSAWHCFDDYKGGWDHRLAFLTVRDPIDRLISAFNWQVKQTCALHNETRTIANPINLAIQYPDKYCKDTKKHNNLSPTGPLFQSSVEIFVSNLCPSSDDHEVGVKVDTTSTAFESMAWRIPHVRDCSLSSYLGETTTTKTFNWQKQVDNLVPIVMEKGWDLKQAVDESIIALFYHSSSNLFQQGENDDNEWLFTMRQTLATCPVVDNDNNLLEGVDDDARSQTKLHTSALSKDGTEKYLSKRSQQCLAKYYQRDYEILQELLDLNACKTEQCVLAIQSILNRRKDVLS